MTDFEIVCPSCGRKSRGKPEFAGRRATCPKCKSVFVVKFKEETPEAEPEEYAIADSPEFDQPAAFDPFASDPDDIPAPPAGFSAYASPKPAMAASDLPESRSYPALNFVRIALLIMAALVAACWLGMLVLLLIGMVLAWSASAEAGATVSTFSFAYLIGTFFSGGITCCALVASSELIKVALDIQSNTLEAARRD